MSSIITITGNLTRDPELKFASSGIATVRFGVAETYKNKDKEYTSFYDVVAFGKNAENVHSSLVKGSGVIVKGRQEIREYERNDGSKGTSVQVIADEVGALLRFATVSITKNERSGTVGFNQSPNRDVSNNNVWDDEQF
jgi:single-strand DNA-binding protein